MRSAIYAGTVMHERLRPRRHRLQYRVFSMLIDLAELHSIGAGSRLLGINRPGVLSFRERDHGDGRTPLRHWAEARLAEGGIFLEGGRIELLCYPRLFGFVFNPLSVYFCYGRDERLRGILYEVSNTHGERHTYVMPAGDGPVVCHAAQKTFFVSPFMPMACTYRFRIRPPGARVGLSILEDDAEGLLLTASFTGRRTELSDRALAEVLLRYPLMTLKVVAAIHWEAVRLLLKGVPFLQHHRAAQRVASSAPMAAPGPSGPAVKTAVATVE